MHKNLSTIFLLNVGALSDWQQNDATKRQNIRENTCNINLNFFVKRGNTIFFPKISRAHTAVFWNNAVG